MRTHFITNIRMVVKYHIKIVILNSPITLTHETKFQDPQDIEIDIEIVG